MGKKLSHIETFHRITGYKHEGPGHSIKGVPGDFRPGFGEPLKPGMLIKCVCGHTSCTYDYMLADDPGACTTCGTALKRFEMFITSYERCYRCEPTQGTHSTPGKVPHKNRCWGFWYNNKPIGYEYTDEWCGYHSRADIPEDELKEFKQDGQRLYCLEWDGEIEIHQSGEIKKFYFRFTSTTPGIVVEKFAKDEY